jgi:hypothetical protein
VFRGGNLYTTGEANVTKFAITTTIPRKFCEFGKRPKEYLNKTTEIG